MHSHVFSEEFSEKVKITARITKESNRELHFQGLFPAFPKTILSASRTKYLKAID